MSCGCCQRIKIQIETATREVSAAEDGYYDDTDRFYTDRTTVQHYTTGAVTCVYPSGQGLIDAVTGTPTTGPPVCTGSHSGSTTTFDDNYSNEFGVGAAFTKLDAMTPGSWSAWSAATLCEATYEGSPDAPMSFAQADNGFDLAIPSPLRTISVVDGGAGGVSSGARKEVKLRFTQLDSPVPVKIILIKQLKNIFTDAPIGSPTTDSVTLDTFDAPSAEVVLQVTAGGETGDPASIYGAYMAVSWRVVAASMVPL